MSCSVKRLQGNEERLQGSSSLGLYCRSLNTYQHKYTDISPFDPFVIIT